MVNRGILGLLQFTALALPAIAIYLDFRYGDIDWTDIDTDDEAVVEGEIHRGRLSVLSLVAGGGLLLFQILIDVPAANESLIGGSECSPTLVMGICSSTALSVGSSTFLFMGLAMFGFLIAFGRTARETDTEIFWGAVDVINQMVPGADSMEDRKFDSDDVGLFSILLFILIILVSIAVVLTILSLPSQIGSVTIILVAAVSSLVTGILVAVCYESRDSTIVSRIKTSYWGRETDK